MYAINRYNWINTLISSIGYIVCIILQTLIGLGQIPDLFKDSFSINGILGVISFSFVIFIIIGSKGKHLKVAVIIQIINILFLFMSVIFRKLYTPLPSIILGCVSIIVCCILSKYLKQLSENASTIDNLIHLDSLTGLLNKRGFMKELYIKSNQGKEFYLAMIDLNDFRRISDITNHSEVDRILKDLAQSWLKIPMDFTLSYFGEGTFALVSEHKKYYIDNIISEMFNSIKLIDSEYNVLITLAVGVSHYTQDTNNIDQLVTYADTAMIKSKEAGKNKVTYFDYDSYNLIKNRYNIERNVRNALVKNKFEILYQPQFSLLEHTIVGFESLLRLRDSNGNFINTQDFINIAENSGLIYEIDLWVIKNVLMQTSEYVKERPEVDISVNVSGKHITTPGFINYIVRCLELANFNPNNLKIEITESSYIKDFEDAIKAINKLKNIGVKIALDDFGTGYSSLSYLTRLPSDLLKIDKSFIDGIELDQSKCNFVGIIIKLGHIMNNKVIAEGVENTEQLTILSVLGCDYIQGYVWGKPMSFEEVKYIEEGQ
jgi:diguanylate cyclase (GGDEF)-like protein